jgi:predicted dehydrogenase
MKPVGIGIVGIGGYGSAYMSMMDQMEKEDCGKLVAVVIRNRAKYAKEVGALEAKGVAIYPNMTEMLAKSGADIEIVAIPTGINTHCTLLIEAAEAGKHIILEKPPTATIQEMDQMLAVLKRTSRWCQVGFQSQGCSTIMALKHRICGGELGRITYVTVRCKETRNDKYYFRNPWAGKIKQEGGWLLDGGVNNPFAHQLMNALYYAKPLWGEIAEPVSVQAELYRAHDIDSEDTACLRVQTKEGPVIHFFSTLAGKANLPMEITVEGENGSALWSSKFGTTVDFKDGRKETIPPPPSRWSDDVFRNAIQYLRGEAKELQCPLAMTRNFVLAVDGAWMSAGVPVKIDAKFQNIRRDEKSGALVNEIPGIEELIDRGSAERKLFSELGAAWAVSRKPFALAGFRHFDLKV